MKYFRSIALFLTFLLASCAGSNFDAYYNSENLPQGSYIPIARGQMPTMRETLNLQEALTSYLQSGYVIIGSLKNDGQNVSMSEIKDFAKSKGASVVVYQQTKVGVVRKSYAVPVVTPETSYYNGTVSNGFNSASFHGSSTTYKTDYIRRNYTVGEYEQDYVFLAKKP